MNKKFNFKSFILGACAALTITSIVSVSAQNIDVIMNGIKIYWDGVEKTMTDVKGNKVEPLIYQGTTYVPVRAMSKLMGKEVNWDQSEMADNINGISYYTKKTLFYLKNEEIDITNGCIRLSRSAKITYVLDGKFSRFTGKMVMPYKAVGSDGEASVTFYSVENDGTENRIKSFDLKQTQEPVNVDVNLVGVTNLRIKVDEDSKSNKEVVIYDANFLGE